MKSDDNQKMGSLWAEAFVRLRKNRMALLSFYFLFCIALISICGAIYSYHTGALTQTDVAVGATPPSLSSRFTPFGTDELGRDLFLRVLSGGCVSLSVGLLATFVALIIGAIYGMISGLASVWLDSFMMRVVDILYALPLIIFVILVSTVSKEWLELFLDKRDWSAWLQEARLGTLFVLIGGINWLTAARIARAETLAVKELEFIDAARAMRVPQLMIIFRHILPNITGSLVVYATLTVPAVILTESTLSFLGLGAQEPLSSWGSLIKDGAEKADVYPWLLFFPALFFSLTLLALNFLGDGLRDALDPRASKV